MNSLRKPLIGKRVLRFLFGELRRRRYGQQNSEDFFICSRLHFVDGFSINVYCARMRTGVPAVKPACHAASLIVGATNAARRARTGSSSVELGTARTAPASPSDAAAARVKRLHAITSLTGVASRSTSGIGRPTFDMFCFSWSIPIALHTVARKSAVVVAVGLRPWCRRLAGLADRLTALHAAAGDDRTPRVGEVVAAFALVDDSACGRTPHPHNGGRFEQPAAPSDRP